MATRTLRATIGAPNTKKLARQPETPMVGAGSLVVSHKGELREAITVRTYYNAKGSGMQPVRACVWIKPADRAGEWPSGGGSAGGCGYHKESQAVADAVSSAGVSLYGSPARGLSGRDTADMKRPFHFGGTGSSYYEEIFKAVARAAGYRGRMVWVSHGL